MIRTVASYGLLAVAFVGLLLGNFGLWAERTVFNTGSFTSTTSRVLDEPAVRDRAAQVLADELIARGEVDQRIESRLPTELALLAPQLEQAAREFVTQVVRRSLDRILTTDVEARVLGGVHSQVLAALEGDNALRSSGGQVYLDLRPVLVAAAEAVGVDANPNGGLLARADLPPEAGRVVISNDPQRFDRLSWAVNHHSAVAAGLVAIPVVAIALAVLVARRRRRAVGAAGLLLVVAGALSLLALPAAAELGGRLAPRPEVFRAALSALMFAYRLQSLLLIALGVAVAAGAKWVRWPGEATAGEEEGARHRQAGLRLGGFVAAALVIFAAPDPGWRLYAGVVLLLGAYLGAVWVLFGESQGALETRERLRRWTRALRSGEPERAGTGGWTARHLNQLRAGGVAVAIVVALAWPSLGARGAGVILVLTVLYLAILEWTVDDTAAGGGEAEEGATPGAVGGVARGRFHPRGGPQL